MENISDKTCQGSLVVRPFFPEVNVGAICGHDEGKEDSAQKEVTEV